MPDNALHNVPVDPILLEPDRPELREGPVYEFAVNRREFIEVAGILVYLSGKPAAAQDTAPSARIQKGADGTITVYSGKVEFGQGARTEIAMAVAEELDVPLEKVRVVLGDTALCPNDGITAGSRTTPSTIPEVRKAAVEMGGKAEPTPHDDWDVLGTPHAHVHGRAVVTGAHQYPSDIRRPNMVYGAILRAPAYNSTLVSVDAQTVAKMPGVVLVQDKNFAGVTAPNSFAARQAIEALAATAKWDTKPHPSHNEVAATLKATAGTPREQVKGSVEDALAAAPKRFKQSYSVPFIQHAPMEPRAAVAEWTDGKLTVWTGTQNPFGVKQQLQQAFRLSPEQVRVIVPDTGGGFGGKHTGECAIEAARLAKECGKPVHLRWTRSEEFTWAYFRPAGVWEIEAALDAGGRITAWDFASYNPGTAALAIPYKIAHVRTRYYDCESPMREGSYRGIAATTNNYARECFMDELAQAASADPLDFRLAHIDNPRLRDVLTAVTAKFNWSARRKMRRPNVGVGLACGTEKGSYIAACCEIEIGSAPGAPLRIREFHAAYECGAILNPSNLQAQVEGALIQGLGGALTEAMEFENGKLLNGAFSKYHVPRFADVPPLTISLLNRPDLTAVGAGETPIIAVAPAIANAYFHASGTRVRSLPVRHT
ncbi:MAG: molybdopterin cofactor-binding domain-containing protein [Acidobacteriota bacterium]